MNLAGVVSCFDARAWLEVYSATAGFHRFSQGFQDSALVSLQERGLIGPNGTYVEFGFHLRDVQGTAARPSVRAGNAPRLHLRPREIPGFGSNTELLRRHFGWTGSRFDADEVNETLAPDLSLEWVTPQTVVSIFRRHGVQTNVDYVSIDIDSCDLWVFLALTDVYRPRLITVECVPPPHGTATQTRSASRC